MAMTFVGSVTASDSAPAHCPRSPAKVQCGDMANKTTALKTIRSRNAKRKNFILDSLSAQRLLNIDGDQGA
jgi:hypothetical protein